MTRIGGDEERERGRVVDEREGSKLGRRTTSSVSNIRASRTCTTDVCCKCYLKSDIVS